MSRPLEIDQPRAFVSVDQHLVRKSLAAPEEIDDLDLLIDPYAGDPPSKRKEIAKRFTIEAFDQ